MKKKVKYIIFSFVLIVALFLIFKPNNSEGNYDSFAECLTGNNVKMYGAFWCSHCNDQKETFGDSWSKINYIECSTPDGRQMTELCRNEGIKGYPTWEFSDGSRQSGFIELGKLSEVSGCDISS